MPPCRGWCIAPFLILCVFAPDATAQAPAADLRSQLIGASAVEPPATLPLADPIADLSARVNTLEEELRKARPSSGLKKPSINWMMQIQIDGVWSGQDENNRAEFGVIQIKNIRAKGV